MLDKTMSSFQNKLKKLMDEYVRYTYVITKKYPKQELYHLVSQHTRASMSVILNYIEGYSRRRKKVQRNFYEISYGSLGESRYIYYFALGQHWIIKEEYVQAMTLANEIGAMLWSEIIAAENSVD